MRRCQSAAVLPQARFSTSLGFAIKRGEQHDLHGGSASRPALLLWVHGVPRAPSKAGPLQPGGEGRPHPRPGQEQERGRSEAFGPPGAGWGSVLTICAAIRVVATRGGEVAPCHGPTPP